MINNRFIIFIRGLLQADAQAFEESFALQGWHKPRTMFERYLSEQNQGQRQVFVAELEGKPVGYVCLLPTAPAGPFANRPIPCISDFNVLHTWQRRGIGSSLMDAAEAAAFQSCGVVSLGVGLHPGYGAAQRMYVKRGYIPDGSGIWFMDQLLPQGAACQNNDDLVLYLSKQRQAEDGRPNTLKDVMKREIYVDYPLDKRSDRG